MKAGNQNKTDKQSTSALILKSVEDLHELPGLVIKYRSDAKLLSTYIIPFIHFQRESGEPGVLGTLKRIYSQWNETSTRTGRLSSAKPNIQNVSNVFVIARTLFPSLSSLSNTFFTVSHLIPSPPPPQVPHTATTDYHPRDAFGCSADR